jgi:acetyl-CoA C-acetyltransferase
MMLDLSKQVTGQAGNYQVGGAKRAAMLNLGGSATTLASFIVGQVL